MEKEKFLYKSNIHISKVSEKHREALIEILSEDPRPSYQNDSDRIYGMAFADYEIKFKVSDGVLTVCEIEHK